MSLKSRIEKLQKKRRADLRLKQPNILEWLRRRDQIPEQAIDRDKERARIQPSSVASQQEDAHIKDVQGLTPLFRRAHPETAERPLAVEHSPTPGDTQKKEPNR